MLYIGKICDNNIKQRDLYEEFLQDNRHTNDCYRLKYKIGWVNRIWRNINMFGADSIKPYQRLIFRAILNK